MRYLLVLCLASLILTSGTAVAIELDQSLKTREEITHIEIFVDPELDFALDSIVERNDNKEWASRILSDTYSVNTWSVNATVLTLQQREDLKTYLLSIEDTSENNGHSFNATAFSAGEKERTFSDVTGRSYDADLTLDWIGENLWNGHQYTHSLFLFDFSDLDRGMDHWFTIKPENLDTGRFVNTFFSGSSGLTNGKSVGGWGGRSDLPVHFIDLSAETWWGDFINGAWGEYGWSGNVISQKIQDFESSITRDSWITDYLNTFMVQTYDFRLFDRAPVGRSVKVQSVVFHDWVDYDISIQDSQWMIQDDIINQTFSTAFPWIRFNISTDWLDLRDYPDVRDEMNRNTALGDEGYELEIFPSFLDYVETSIIPRFFDFNGEDVILPSIVFFLNQTRFTYTGIPIAGIGGIGYQLQGLTPDRYYFDNGTEMRGFSDVIVHEIGHSLGLPHPFSNTDSWAGDFSASVMGYYTSYPQFSQYDINTLGFYHGNYYLIMAEQMMESYSPDPANEEDYDIFVDWYNRAVDHQKRWQFGEGIPLAIQSVCGLGELSQSDNNALEWICDGIDITTSIEVEISSQTFTSEFETTGQETSTQETSLKFTLAALALIPILRRKR